MYLAMLILIVFLLFLPATNSMRNEHKPTISEQIDVLKLVVKATEITMLPDEKPDDNGKPYLWAPMNFKKVLKDQPVYNRRITVWLKETGSKNKFDTFVDSHLLAAVDYPQMHIEEHHKIPLKAILAHVKEHLHAIMSEELADLDTVNLDARSVVADDAFFANFYKILKDLLDKYKMSSKRKIGRVLSEFYNEHAENGQSSLKNLLSKFYEGFRKNGQSSVRDLAFENTLKMVPGWLNSMLKSLKKIMKTTSRSEEIWEAIEKDSFDIKMAFDNEI